MLSENMVLQGRYTVVRHLGQGGMGAVYLAHDRRFHDRPVALKETLVDRGQVEMRRQFEREALLLFDLKHQALPRVFDYFSEGGGEFLVMEYVEGPDLSQYLSQNRAPFSVRQVLGWGDQLLDALEYLHGQEPPVIHRDIKPNNIKITPKGQVVLLDFGLAKGSMLRDTRQLTQSVSAGTPSYAPLEQMNGEGTDQRSDLYSLAATMYALLSRRLPVDAGRRATELINGRPDPLEPLTSVLPDFPAEVWEVLKRTLTLAKAGRPATAREMREMLNAAVRQIVSRSNATMVGPIPALEPIVRQTEPYEVPQSQTVPAASGVATAPTVIDAGQTVHVPIEPTIVVETPAPPTGHPLEHMQARAHPTPSSARTVQQDPSPHPAAHHVVVPPTADAPGPERTGGARAWLVAVVVLAVFAGAAVPLWIYVIEPAMRPPAAGPAPASSTAPAATAPPAPPPVKYVESVRWQFERADGTPLDTTAGPVATGGQFRLRFASSNPGYVYLLAPDDKGTWRAYLTARPAPELNVASNAVGRGKDVVFPGPPYTLSVTEGTTRFLVVVASTADLVPAALAGDAQTEIDDADVKALEARGQQSAGDIRTDRGDGGWVTVSRPESFAGAVVFEISIEGRAKARGKGE